MRLKTYFATSVEAAMARARTDLGSDAMLVHSRRISTDAEVETPVESTDVTESFNYEVVFAIEVPAAQPEESLSPSLTSARSTGPEPSNKTADQTPGAQVENLQSWNELRQDLREIRHSIAQVSESIHATELNDRKRRLAGTLPATAFAELRQCGFREHFVFDLLAGCTSAGRDASRKNLQAELERRLHCLPGVGHSESPRSVVALVGPAGAGKTTLCAKLATNLGIARQRPTHLISIDSGRVGGSDLIQSLGHLLGIGVSVLESASALPQRLDQLRHSSLVIIDTPGFSPGADRSEPAGHDAADEDFSLLRNALRSRAEIETQLVLPATFDLPALRRHLEYFQALNPSRLILTHFDAACLLGEKLEFACESSLPLSYLSCGQNIPEDLEEAESSRLGGEAFARRRHFRLVVPAAKSAAASASQDFQEISRTREVSDSRAVRLEPAQRAAA